MLQRLCNRRMNPESPNEDPKDYKQEWKENDKEEWRVMKQNGKVMNEIWMNNKNTKMPMKGIRK